MFIFLLRSLSDAVKATCPAPEPTGKTKTGNAHRKGFLINSPERSIKIGFLMLA
jgi:hypothetical protein